MTQEPIDNQCPARMPPQAIEMEQAVLGAMMLEQRAVGHAIEILAPSSNDVVPCRMGLNRSFDEAYDDLRYVCEMFVKGHQFGAVLHG